MSGSLLQESEYFSADPEDIFQELESSGPGPETEAEKLSNERAEKILSGEIKPWKDHTPLQFKSPVDLISFFSENIRAGHIKLYDWQKEIGEFLALPHWKKESPLRFYLRAANGSGKDAYILATHAVWFCGCKIRSRWICTSKSFKQISTQTEPYIKQICQEINNFYEGEVFIIRKQHIVCTLTGSEILMYVSDDPDNIEGYHPFPDYPQAELAVVVNEAKSVDDEIFHALRRCTGFSIWLEVSSPGKATGHFYEKSTSARDWAEGYKIGQGFCRKVTAYECPHFAASEIEEARADLPHWLFASIYLAEFSSLDEEVLILPELLQKVMKSGVPPISFGSLRAGFDFAAGGDENGAYLIDGNTIKDRVFFREVDTTVAAHRFFTKINQWEKLGLRQENCFGDDGGIGRGILDQIREKGWSINRVVNQWAAINKKRYSNRGAELWYEGGRIITEGFFCLPNNDPVLIKQLGQRYYHQGETSGKMALESKKAARAKGRPSPDRADALMLALAGLNVDDFRAAFEKLKPKKAQENQLGPNSIKLRGIEALENFMDELTLGEVKPPKAGKMRRLASFFSPRRKKFTFGGRINL
jgi:hypothetical protein